MSKSESVLEGKVEGDQILIFSEMEDLALQTLCHEFLDSLISEAVEPYRELVNAQRLVITGLLNSLEEKAYQKKETLVSKWELVLDALDTKENTV